MSVPTIHGKRIAVTASNVLNAIGNDLLQIKMQDGLRWADIGEILGKSEDQAAKYADGSASMDVVAYAKGRTAWNGRFTGSLDRLIEQAKPEANAHNAQSCILKAALALSVALEDGDLTVDEIRKNRATLEMARGAIDDQLARLTVRAA
ncbi:hypothetical protein SH584_11365 [Sphingomonas sp. LY29]|uniref:hypothetical protein n=1 Tax=Sphingomonas sp. LY29 TaxID=3095341 RepID=UPI002D79098D|nr:hypothetical protein [Sphingomonas sp. LY29]WRP25630.1 hypothetical protein SH584_11365 [Sphingomonas sp. LY29]